MINGTEKILVSCDGPVATVTFNDPSTLNALTAQFLTDFRQILRSIEKTPEIKVVILTGAGKAFIAGADITYMRTMTPLQASQYARDIVELYRIIEEMDRVFIAAVNGYALGGGFELSLACDLRVASEKARFGLPEVSLGIFPAGGGTQRLPRLVGEAVAKELIFTADTVKAQRALEIGMVNTVVEPDKLMEAAYALAARICKNSLSAVALAKRSINGGAQMGLDAAIERDQGLFGMCFGTPDQQEGMAAFQEKRSPVFEHQRSAQ